MIDDSYPWKKSLLSAAIWLDKTRLDQRNSSRSFVRVEKELFIGFYAIRKLFDTLTVTDKTKAKTFKLKWSPRIRTVDCLNWQHIDKNFDLKTTRSETRNIRFICDQFVHSYVFVIKLGREGRLSGVYVSSDRARHAKLYFIAIRQLLSAFRTVARDDPMRLDGTRDKQTGQFEFIVK
jgi:hypothetical protein